MRQSKNIGIFENFNFLLGKATEKYFMWAAADDWRSPEFLEVNVSALEGNKKFVASTSPNCHEGEENNPKKYIDFNIEGTPKERFVKFLENAWFSHAIFYSLIRTEIIQEYKYFDFSCAAADWSVDFFLCSKGEINRTKEGLTVFGRYGASVGKNPWKEFRNKRIEFFIPLYEFTKYALSLMKNLDLHEWGYVLVRLLKLNLKAIKSNLRLTIVNLISKN